MDWAAEMRRAKDYRAGYRTRPRTRVRVMGRHLAGFETTDFLHFAGWASFRGICKSFSLHGGLGVTFYKRRLL